MWKLDLKVFFAERKLKTTLVFLVLMYVVVFQLSYNVFWRALPKKTFSSDASGWLGLWKSLPDWSNTEDASFVHVHIEGVSLGHTGVGTDEQPNIGASGRTSIAIGGGITSKHLDRSAVDHIADAFQLFSKFLPSFCKTASPGFDYRFYFAFDATDALFREASFLTAFQKTFVDTSSRLCSHLWVSLHLVECSHTGNPAWAQNDAMMEAYLDNADYHYRINDDTIMKTGNWTHIFIAMLDDFDPPKIGVVGPTHSGGNTAILTYDFVHRTHVNIFGFYYPRLFTDWFADGWITRTYRPDRSKKASDVHLIHTLSLGQRYHVKGGRGSLQAPRVEADIRILNRYINYTRTKHLITVDGKKVISMSLFGRNPKYTMGAIRNAQVAPIFFPGWKLRIYIPHWEEETQPVNDNLMVPKRILNKLKELGVEIAYVKQNSIYPGLWRYLVMDDTSVDYFVVRNAERRLCERDAAAVNEWLRHQSPDQNLNALHCVRDHPNHAKVPIVEGLWGGNRVAIRKTLKKPIASLLDTFYNAQNKSLNGSAGLVVRLALSHRNSESFNVLEDILWPLLSPTAYCHDSVSCTKWPNAHKFPIPRNGSEYLGQEYDQYQEPVKTDDDLVKRMGSQCTGDVQQEVTNATLRF